MRGTTTSVTVRLWASARAAAGVGELAVPVPGPVTLTDLTGAVVAQAAQIAGDDTHPENQAVRRERAVDAGRLERVLTVCSVLVGEHPVGSADPATVVVEPGATVEYLPPFAGG